MSHPTLFFVTSSPVRSLAFARPCESRNRVLAIEKLAYGPIWPSIKNPITTPSSGRKIG